MRIIAAYVLLSLTAQIAVAEADSGAQSCRSTLKKGRCPSTLINPSAKECISSTECKGNQLCCYDTDKRSRCSDPLETKSNECPPPRNITQIAETTCDLDSDCPGSEKCCRQNSCTYTCVNPTSANIIINTRQATCQNDVPEEARCPAPAIGEGVTCTSTADCTTAKFSMCCADRTGALVCSEPDSNRRDLGTCPDPTSPEYDAEGATCLLDSNCPESQRCCPTANNCLSCQRVKPSTSGSSCMEKRGVCPVVLINEDKTTCTNNAQCPGNRLCCKRSIGTDFRCSDPYTDRTGKCPSRGSVVGTKSCFTDANCASGEKCCPINNCTYRCTAVSSLPDPLYCEPGEKFGVCPFNRINPSTPCDSNQVCPGRQLCCDGTCSDPSTSKRGNCPAPTQVPRGPSNCFTDENCSGARNRKCCPDARCNYYCTWGVA